MKRHERDLSPPLDLAGVRYHLENIALNAQRAVFYDDNDYHDEVTTSRKVLIEAFRRIKRDNYQQSFQIVELENEVRRLRRDLSHNSE